MPDWMDTLKAGRDKLNSYHETYQQKRARGEPLYKVSSSSEDSGLPLARRVRPLNEVRDPHSWAPPPKHYRNPEEEVKPMAPPQRSAYQNRQSQTHPPRSPPQQGYTTQQGYPPQQRYPPQQGYPPQSYPPQGSHPQQRHSPPSAPNSSLASPAPSAPRLGGPPYAVPKAAPDHSKRPPAPLPPPAQSFSRDPAISMSPAGTAQDEGAPPLPRRTLPDPNAFAPPPTSDMANPTSEDIEARLQENKAPYPALSKLAPQVPERPQTPIRTASASNDDDNVPVRRPARRSGDSDTDDLPAPRLPPRRGSAQPSRNGTASPSPPSAPDGESASRSVASEVAGLSLKSSRAASECQSVHSTSTTPLSSMPNSASTSMEDLAARARAKAKKAPPPRPSAASKP